MFPYIIMFAHFVISFVVVFFAYRALVTVDKLRVSISQSAIAVLALLIPTFLTSFIGLGIVGVVIGAVILLFLQRSYIKDIQKSAILTLKIAAILVLVISIILVASGFILK